LEACTTRGLIGTRAALQAEVDADDKNRFELDGDRIRCRQGHSIPVDLGLRPVPPPAVLYHGTVARFLPSIRVEGLLPRGRQHVHLSEDRATATAVGGRRGSPVVVEVLATDLAETGTPFFLSSNGVWLVDHVPPSFLRG
jgi:putative RNA 2'-phosphotransferase